MGRGHASLLTDLDTWHSKPFRDIGHLSTNIFSARRCGAAGGEPESATPAAASGLSEGGGVITPHPIIVCMENHYRFAKWHRRMPPPPPSGPAPERRRRHGRGTGRAPPAPAPAFHAQTTGYGSTASSLCTAAHLLHTGFTNVFGASLSNATMRPNPSSGLVGAARCR